MRDFAMPHCHTLIETLHQRGLRITPQREMIVEAICHSERHMTVEEIFEQVQARTSTISLTTVYRTLDLLFAEGLVSRISLGGGQVAYATARHGPHVHLVCRRCGQDIEAECRLITPLVEQFRAQYGFAADSQHISIFGVCTECQSESQSQGGKSL
jgi:Fur family ferric uptake transcriptional regulator